MAYRENGAPVSSDGLKGYKVTVVSETGKVEILTEGPNAAIGTVVDILTGKGGIDIRTIDKLELDLNGEATFA